MMLKTALLAGAALAAAVTPAAAASRGFAVEVPAVTGTMDGNEVYHPWDDVLAGIKAIAGEKAKIAGSPSFGVVTVANVSERVLDQVGAYVATTNKSLARLVAIRFTLLENGKAVEQFYGITFAGKPFSHHDGRDIAYPQRVEPRPDGQTAVTVATTPTGLTATVLARPLDDGTIAVQYHISYGELIAMKNVDIDGTAVELPELDVQDDQQSVTLRSGGSIRQALGIGDSPLSYVLTVEAL